MQNMCLFCFVFNKIENAKIPQMEGPYNEKTSFITNRRPEEVYAHLISMLKDEKNMDVQPHERAYKIRGRKFHDSHLMCEWQIELFTLPKNHPTYSNHVVVEVMSHKKKILIFYFFVYFFIFVCLFGFVV